MTIKGGNCGADTPVREKPRSEKVRRQETQEEIDR
jgi:hypothetical protein